MSKLESYFGSVPDPRRRNASYRLGDLVVMMIAASLCGAKCYALTKPSYGLFRLYAMMSAAGSLFCIFPNHLVS